MKKWTFVLLCLFMSIGFASAQTKVTGVVISAEDGQPVIGASVKVKGAASGTITDTDGKFSIVAPVGAKLVEVSFVGMQTQEVTVAPTLRVVLKGVSKELNEVVVTALGIKRSEKSLGYAASTVKSDELTKATPLSVTSGLTGKVAGLNISNSGGTGTSERVIIRGVTSFSSNAPLYVVDGIPISNSFMGTASTNQAVDFGNQAGDINPQDVESVTVLKGASATALYGSRAANGVILITTKRGTTDSRIRVSYNGSYTASNVLRTPQMQNRFGQGWPLLNQSGTAEPGLGENGSWGPALDGMDRKWGAPLNAQGVYSPTGVQRVKPFAFVEDNVKNFYETGMEYNNNISISSGNENTSFVLSYNNVKSDGVLPSNADKYGRNTLSFRGDAKYKRFHVSVDANYVRKDISNVRAGQGGATGATTFQDLIQTPVDVNFQDLKDYNNPYNNLDNFYTGYAQNPYWIIANNRSVYQDDRTYGKVEVDVELIKGLKAIGRMGADFTSARTRAWSAQVAQSSTGWAMQFSSKSIPGNYDEYNAAYSQLDATSMLAADYNLGKSFRVTGNLGWNLNQRTTYSIDSYQGTLDVPDWYNLQNGTTNPLVTSSKSLRRLVGVFAQGDISFQNWAFLGLSARNDFSSTLPIGKNSYFYGGINAAVILTDALPAIKSDLLNYLKLRASVGQTGNDAGPYRTYNKMIPTQIGLGFGSLFLPLNGYSGMTISNNLANQDLKPEITTEKEIGIDLKMLNNRFGVDAAYYNKDTKNQIIDAGLAPESGYTTRVRNVGWINNQGVELRVYGSPIKTKNFEWELGMTYTKNVSEVKELWDNVQNYLYTSAYDVNYMMIKGQPVGVFQVPKIRTVTDATSPYYGKTVVNSTGLPQILSNEFNTIGNSNPDFVMGFTTGLTYKNLNFTAVVDYREGGYFYSNTARMLDWNGNGTNTMFNNRQPFMVPNSVKELSPNVYAENDIPLMATSGVLNYWNYSSSNKGMESNAVLSRTYVKLREVSLNYNLPKKLFAHSFISGVQLSVIGRNLLMWTAAQNNFVDPDQTNYGNDLLSMFGEFSSAPTVRNIGGSVKVNF